MISFENDYNTGAHPLILKRLAETNFEPLPGYGADPYCESAKSKIRKACGRENAAIEFLTGGTQTNSIVVSALLKDYEGVIAAKTGHISTHEAGAIEYTGHKILEIEQKNGKILPSVLKQYLEDFYSAGNHSHMVYPGMVYISHPTEYGTLYTKQELTEIHEIAQRYGIPLFIDGARLGYGLMSLRSDMTLSDIAGLCDVFYIGGTKVGALCGEAVVFSPEMKPAHFMTSVKKRGALLAKGRLLGIQYDKLFTDGLYVKIARNAIDTASVIVSALKEKGYTFHARPQTNQIFIEVSNADALRLAARVEFSTWEKLGTDRRVIRLSTSWATRPEDAEALAGLL